MLSPTGSRAVLLLALTLGLSPYAEAQHATAFDIEDGGRAFATACAACHGPDGNLIAGIDFSRGAFRRPLTDDEMAGIILRGIPGTPMPPAAGMSREQAARIVAYLRSLPEAPGQAASAGDAGRGRDFVMEGGDCLTCHRIGNVGSRLGPDLSRIGLVRRAAELLRSLLDPAAEIEPGNRFYTVTPRVGEPVTGRLLNHDTFSVQLMDADGQLRSFQKSALRAFGFAAAPMPSYRDSLDADQLADVVSYLVSLRGGSAP
jgi:putative heme-binding domain-containing protein